MIRREIHIVPEEFQSHLNLLGGFNRYDEPNFKLVWAQYYTYRSGGVWSVNESYYHGYRDLLACSNEPCWALLQWHAPEEYGTPEFYYLMNRDETTGLQILGEYPYSGRYEVLYHLRYRDIINGRIEFETIPLNTLALDLIIPVILAAKSVSLEKRRAALEEARAQEEAAKTGEIERHLRDRALPFHSAVSFTRQGIRSTVIDQKMLAMQRTWDQAARNAKTLRPGLSTR